MVGATPTAKWEQLFGAAFRRSENPMSLLTIDRVIRAINPAFTTAFGYRPEALIGRRAEDFVAPASREQFERDWETLKATGRFTADRPWIHADGRVLIV